MPHHPNEMTLAPPQRGKGAHPARSVKVVCVDDHAVLVEGLKAQFAIDGHIEIIGRLRTAARLVEEVERLRPQAVLLDIEMPGPDVFEIASRLSRSHPEIRLIVLSAHVRDACISASFAAGACAYFAKSDELEDIVRGIHEVMALQPESFLLSPKVRERCRPVSTSAIAPHTYRTVHGNAASSATQPRTRVASLTPREIQILRMIGKGLSRVQIAAQLCRSAKTVDGHQERMMKKLDIVTRADLMLFAIREGLARA